MDPNTYEPNLSGIKRVMRLYLINSKVNGAKFIWTY